MYSCPTLATVSLGIFNMLGQAVAVLLHERPAAGQYQATWNANVPSGIYFYRLQVGHFLETKKMVAVTYHERRAAKAVFMASMPQEHDFGNLMTPFSGESLWCGNPCIPQNGCYADSCCLRT